RHFGLALQAVAWHVLPKGTTAKGGAHVRLEPPAGDRDQWFVLFATAPGELRTLVCRHAGELRLRGEGAPLHHSYAAPPRRAGAVRQLPRFRRVQVGPQARPDPLAVSAELPLR